MIRSQSGRKRGMGRASPPPAAPAARAAAAAVRRRRRRRVAARAARRRRVRRPRRRRRRRRARVAREAAGPVAAVEQFVAPRPLERRRVHAVDAPQSINDLVVAALRRRVAQGCCGRAVITAADGRPADRARRVLPRPLAETRGTKDVAAAQGLGRRLEVLEADGAALRSGRLALRGVAELLDGPELARRGLVLAAPPVAPRKDELPITSTAFNQPVNENPE